MPKEIYIDENGNERILSSSPSALSGLLDTDITTPSANQVLAYDGSKWGNSEPLVKSWTGLGYFQLDNNATGDWTLNNSVEGATDLLLFVSVDITGQPYNMPRNSMIVPIQILEGGGAIFYDFYVGSRTYFKLTKVSNTKFNISLTTGAGSNTRVHAYCR